MRHNVPNDLEWQHGGELGTIIAHDEPSAVDYVQESESHNYPVHKHRILMVIRAFNPERITESPQIRAMTTPRMPS